MKAKVKRWLEEGIVDLFLGYKMVMGHPLPYIASARDDFDAVDELVDGPARYSAWKRWPRTSPPSIRTSKSACWPGIATSGP
jgi:hypothetical protein